MRKPLLSITIPTKNRQKYCIAAVSQIISLHLEDIEICIQDNSDTNMLQREINSLQCGYIKYRYVNKVLSFVENFNLAIAMSSGEYVCIIGDDDGVLPNIIDVVKWAKNNKADVVIPRLNSDYIWPSSTPIKEEYKNGYLRIQKFIESYQLVNHKKALIKLLKDGALNYNTYDLPRVYHGIAKRALFEQIKNITGTYFGGLTPDIYMASALTFVSNRVYRYTAPITIAGVCPNSGSADSATGRHTGKLSDAPHFKGHISYIWDDLIPPFYSVETIWAESLLKAIRDFNKEHLIDLFSISKLNNICRITYPQYNELILEHSKAHNIKIWDDFEYFLYRGYKYIDRLFRKKNTDRMEVKTYYNIPDIIEAVKVITNLFK